MKLHYQKYLKPYARRLRRAGNLAEVILWAELKKDKLGYRFLRQRPIGKYIVDFYCHSLRLAIEIDGASSHDAKILTDEKRQIDLESQGVRIIRFLDKDVRSNMEGVVASIRAEILRLINSPPPLKNEE